MIGLGRIKSDFSEYINEETLDAMSKVPNLVVRSEYGNFILRVLGYNGVCNDFKPSNHIEKGYIFTYMTKDGAEYIVYVSIKEILKAISNKSFELSYGITITK